MADNACSQCNAWYNSEHELSDHLRIFHRRFDPEQSGSGPGDAESGLTPAVVIKPEDL
jgi:hypothetical protein